MLVERWRMLLARRERLHTARAADVDGDLLTIMAGFTTLLVSTSRAELDMNNRFAAQTEARLGLTRLRREVHCAISGVTAAGPPGTQRATLTLNTACPTAGAGAVVTWCTVQNGTGRYGLWRYVGAACSGTGVKVADYLSSPSPFTYYAQNDREPRQAQRALRRQPDPHEG